LQAQKSSQILQVLFLVTFENKEIFLIVSRLIAIESPNERFCFWEISTKKFLMKKEIEGGKVFFKIFQGKIEKCENPERWTKSR